MDLEKISAAVKKGEASFFDVADHVKRGEFTWEEFNAFQQKTDQVPLDQLVADFYAGELFRSQENDFIAWCDRHHQYNDMQKAEAYESMAATTGKHDPEIERYIRYIIRRKRKSMKVLDLEGLDERKRTLDAYNSFIDSNGWRTWPKARAQQEGTNGN